MKPLKCFLLSIACLGFLINCSTDEIMKNDQAEISLQKAKKSQETVFVVAPNGVDDTENLVIAFDQAKSAGYGTIVQLVEGTYHVNFIEIREFNGSFIGAGIGKTIITAVNELDIDELLNQHLNTVLIRFVGGNVNMQNMTLKHDDPEAIRIDGLAGFSALTAQYVSDDEYINAKVDQVEFLGDFNSTLHGLKAESGYTEDQVNIPLSDMDISVTNCTFTNFAWYGALMMQIKAGKVIAGTRGNGNVFSNSSLGLWHNTSIEILVQDNTFNCQGAWFPFQLVAGPWPAVLQQASQSFQSICLVEKNIFNVSQSTGGLLINDNRRMLYPEELPMLVTLKNNRFNSNATERMIASLNTNGMVIRNNKFTGNGTLGVLIRQQAEEYNENGLMLGNNFSNTDYTDATVYLTTYTRDWTIVGGNLGESIIDEGTNNVITGFNNGELGEPLGQRIVDNLKMAREQMHQLRN